MKSDNQPMNTIDEYIESFPPDVQILLQSIRRTIHAAAPNAVEKISYQMPTFWLQGNLVHFAAHRQHIGFYPTPSGIDAFKDRLSGYNMSKGAVQFPYDKPLPLDLIAEIVRFRVAENLAKRDAK